LPSSGAPAFAQISSNEKIKAHDLLLYQRIIFALACNACSAAERIETKVARWQSKMGSRWRAIVYTDSNGRRRRPAIGGRIWQARTKIDTDMTADPFATRTIFGRCARLKRGASLARHCLIGGLKITRPRGLSKTKPNGHRAATNRNDNFAQIHLKPKRFIQRSRSIF
jgi:hypothetical protein